MGRLESESKRQRPNLVNDRDAFRFIENFLLNVGTGRIEVVPIGV